MDWEDGRKEYVLNETGRVYTGGAKTPNSNPWNFGQVFSAFIHKIFLSVGQWSHAVSDVRGREGCARDALLPFSCRYRKKFT